MWVLPMLPEFILMNRQASEHEEAENRANRECEEVDDGDEGQDAASPPLPHERSNASPGRDQEAHSEKKEQEGGIAADALDVYQCLDEEEGDAKGNEPGKAGGTVEHGPVVALSVRHFPRGT